VPHIHNAKEVEEIVQAAKFPPLGKRGYGGLCLSGKWGIQAGIDWMEWSNRETLVIPMIEDVSAIPNLEEIMRVEGLDGVFFGPADFSVSAGIPLQTGHEKVIGALRRVVEVSKKYGKFVIFGAGFPQWEKAHQVKDLGVQAIELGHDVTILQAVWLKTLREMGRTAK
jgi:4-hydroxy-2-oxoheptanedioate aldolase